MIVPFLSSRKMYDDEPADFLVMFLVGALTISELNIFDVFWLIYHGSVRCFNPTQLAPHRKAKNIKKNLKILLNSWEFRLLFMYVCLQEMSFEWNISSSQCWYCANKHCKKGRMNPLFPTTQKSTIKKILEQLKVKSVICLYLLRWKL